MSKLESAEFNQPSLDLQFLDLLSTIQRRTPEVTFDLHVIDTPQDKGAVTRFAFDSQTRTSKGIGFLYTKRGYQFFVTGENPEDPTRGWVTLDYALENMIESGQKIVVEDAEILSKFEVETRVAYQLAIPRNDVRDTVLDWELIAS